MFCGDVDGSSNKELVYSTVLSVIVRLWFAANILAVQCCTKIFGRTAGIFSSCSEESVNKYVAHNHFLALIEFLRVSGSEHPDLCKDGTHKFENAHPRSQCDWSCAASVMPCIWCETNDHEYPWEQMRRVRLLHLCNKKRDARSYILVSISRSGVVATSISIGLSWFGNRKRGIVLSSGSSSVG